MISPDLFNKLCSSPVLFLLKSDKRVIGVFGRHSQFQRLELWWSFLTRRWILNFLIRRVLLLQWRVMRLYWSWRLFCNRSWWSFSVEWWMSHSCLLWRSLRCWLLSFDPLLRCTKVGWTKVWNSNWCYRLMLLRIRVFTSPFWGSNNFLLLKPLSEAINLRKSLVKLRLDQVGNLSIGRNVSVEQQVVDLFG